MPEEKILIIDDEPLIRWALGEALRNWGYQAIEAATAAEARRQFEQIHPMAVLLDINLPDGSGLELLQSFKSQRPHTVVIMITAEVIIEHAIAALRGGADDFIGKPINIDELHFALADALTARQQKRDLLIPGRPRLLLITDTAERLSYLTAALNTSHSEITSAKSHEEVMRACQERHDLVIVDVAPAQLKDVLDIVRDSPRHTEIPLLVAIGRIAAEPGMTGLLLQYRAMPCGPSELVALARRRLTTITERQGVRQVL